MLGEIDQLISKLDLDLRAKIEESQCLDFTHVETSGDCIIPDLRVLTFKQEDYSLDRVVFK
jgi:hypothetical protein